MWLKATARLAPLTDRCRIPYRTPNRLGRQEPMVSRIYVEKKPGFDVEAQQLKGELTEILGIKGIEALRIINRYDVEGIDEELFARCVPTVFSEPQVDFAYDELPADELQRDGADPVADAARKQERARAGIANIRDVLPFPRTAYGF